MDGTTTYHFSESGVKQAKWHTLVLLILFPILLAVFFALSPTLGPDSVRLSAFVIAVTIIEVVLIISTAITLPKCAR